MALSNCVAKEEVNPRHLQLTKAECEGKESCFLQPSEELYGKVDSCQNKDNLSTLWLTYCDGGTQRKELNHQCQDLQTCFILVVEDMVEDMVEEMEEDMVEGMLEGPSANIPKELE